MQTLPRGKIWKTFRQVIDAISLNQSAHLTQYFAPGQALRQITFVFCSEREHNKTQMSFFASRWLLHFWGYLRSTKIGFIHLTIGADIWWHFHCSKYIVRSENWRFYDSYRSALKGTSSVGHLWIFLSAVNALTS